MTIPSDETGSVRTIIERDSGRAWSDEAWDRYKGQRLCIDSLRGLAHWTFSKTDAHVGGLVLREVDPLHQRSTVEEWGMRLYVEAIHPRGTVLARDRDFRLLGLYRCKRIGSDRAPWRLSFQGISAETVRVIEGPAASWLGLRGPVDKRPILSHPEELARIGNLSLRLSKKFNSITKTEEDVVEVANVM